MSHCCPLYRSALPGCICRNPSGTGDMRLKVPPPCRHFQLHPGIPLPGGRNRPSPWPPGQAGQVQGADVLPVAVFSVTGGDRGPAVFLSDVLRSAFLRSAAFRSAVFLSAFLLSGPGGGLLDDIIYLVIIFLPHLAEPAYLRLVPRNLPAGPR